MQKIDQEIIEKIKLSKILNQYTKSSLLKYFTFLSVWQKELLREVFSSEKNLIINFLEKLQNKKEISFEYIKESLDQTIKQRIKNLESQHEKNKSKELNDLLTKL